MRTAVATTAAAPGIGEVFAAPRGCTLSFGSTGAFATGHIDIVRRDGTIACSSLPGGLQRGYAGAPWLAGALKGPTLVGPVLDDRTGKQVVLSAAPVPGKGAVVEILDLVALGPGLASEIGGPRHLEFLATSADGKVVLSRSIDPAHWAGVSVARAPFAARTSQVQHRDLDGNSRLYGHAMVEQLGWRVYAGASTSEALIAVNRLNNRQLAITLVGLSLFLAAAFVFSRRIAQPITKLSAAVRAATAHGATVPVPSSPIAVGGPAEVVRLADDCNQLIWAANRQVETTARLAAIVESSADAIFGKTLEGEITSWNAGAEHMFGYTADEMIGRNVSDLIPLDRAGELAPIFDHVRQGERVVELETKRLRNDGRLLDVSISVSPIRDGTGALVGASTVSRDVTERNRAEADRRALEDRLHQTERLKSLGQLAGGIAHDFNNLLGAIMNYAAFVAERTADRPAVLADVEQIQVATERAARLTKQLLTFARRETLTPETLDLNAIIADIENMLSRSLDSQIVLVVHPGANLPTIRADLGQVEQVILNLAINARDAMPKGGTLTIETHSVDIDEGYARLHPDVSPGRYVDLAVSDTGIGMSAEVTSHILEPFYTTKPKGQGTGLGLATVYGVVTEAGGGMSVYSEEGIGSTFRLYFPAAGPPAATTSAAATTSDGATTAAGPQGNGETILVVEDEPGVLQVTCEILRQNGYAVLEAPTSEEALRLATAHDFQLLLTDSVIPHMSGRVLAAQIDDVRPGRAVLYMSGYGLGVLHPERVTETGAAILQKPFNQQTLLERVRATIMATPGAPSNFDAV